MPEHDDSSEHELSYWNNEYHNHTKPCLSDHHAKIQEQEDELASVSEINLKFDEPQVRNESVLMLKELPVEKAINEPAITLELKDETNNLEENKNQVNVWIADITPVFELAKKKEEQSYFSFEWNNFLVRRACFRGVSVYYKNKFSKINTSWQRKRINKTKKIHMHVLIRAFAEHEFGTALVSKLTDEQWITLRNTLYIILFSHRYKKNDDFLEGIDFTLVRGVLYSYTTEARVKLMSNPFFSLLILHFLEHGKEEFMKGKIEGKPAQYAEELVNELESLKEESTSYLIDYNFYD